MDPSPAALPSFVLFYYSFCFVLFRFVKLVGNAQVQLQIAVHKRILMLIGYLYYSV